MYALPPTLNQSTAPGHSQQREEEGTEAHDLAQLAPPSILDYLANEAEPTALKLNPAATPPEPPRLGALVLDASEELLSRYVNEVGFTNYHVEVYDRWILETARHNVSLRIVTLKDGRFVTFDNLTIMKPHYTRDGKPLPMTPKFARENGQTYGSDWYVDASLYDPRNPNAERQTIRNICIGTIPTMLKSQGCILHGKDAQQLALLGEDPKDPGGYFIVSGVEKVVLGQEQLAVNKIFLMNRGGVMARMTANTIRGTALIELALDKKTHSIIKIRFPALKPPKKDIDRRDPSSKSKKAKKAKQYGSINALSIFRIFGIDSPEEITEWITRFLRPEHVDKCVLKLARGIVDFQLIPDDKAMMMRKKEEMALIEPSPERDQEVEKILENDLFPHLNQLAGPNGETEPEKKARIIRAKLNLLAIMIARFLENLAGYTPLDDRDAWSNKRVETAGRMMEQLFRNAWRKVLHQVQDAISNNSIHDLPGIVNGIRYGIITDTFHDSFTSNKWGVKGQQLKNNVAQTVSRDSRVAAYAHLNTIDVSISRTDQQHSIRKVQNDQWGFIDSVYSPEGENAGILKNVCLTAKVSLERKDTEIVRFLIGDPEKGAPIRVSDRPEVRDEGWTDKIMVNGKFLGWCDGDAVRDALIEGRRNGTFPLDMSVIRDTNSWLYVDTGPSRLIRPLLIVNPETQRLVLDEAGLRGANNYDLFVNGAMEYISAWEQQQPHIKIATSVAKLQERQQLFEETRRILQDAILQQEAVRAGEEVWASDVSAERIVLTLSDAESRVASAQENWDRLVATNRIYTHCELDAQAILGVASSLIPYIGHNQAPRNTYQVSMGKQSLGPYHINHLNRFDGKTKVLVSPNEPVVETQMYRTLGLDTQPTGENVTVAFMAYPYTEEDAFVVKREFLDRGGFRIMKYFTYKTIVKQQGQTESERLKRPELQSGDPPERYKYIQQGDENSPMNGLPMLGAPLKQGDCVIGKLRWSPQPHNKLTNESVWVRVGDEGIVEKVLVTTDNKTTIVAVKLRIMLVPQEGDKFAPRNAQKGTIGLVESEIDLPRTATGLVPDIIVNPSSLPSRMTISYLMELIAGKAAAFTGDRIDAGAFKPFHFKEIRETLKEYDFEEFGYENLYSGMSGRPLEAKIYMGPVYFQALRHHVKDKIQVRSRGSVKPMTRQPPKGKSNRGGLRFGEMERDAAISHGASSFVRERLMLISDGYQTVFCKTCGTFAVNDPGSGGYKPCKLCQDDRNFGRCTIPYVYKLLIHWLGAIGINLRPELMSMDEYAASVLAGSAGVTHVNPLDLEGHFADELGGYEEQNQEYLEEELDQIDDSYQDE